MFKFKRNFASNINSLGSPTRVQASRLTARLEGSPLALASPTKRIRLDSPQRLSRLDSPRRNKLADDDRLLLQQPVVVAPTSFASPIHQSTKHQLLDLLNSPQAITASKQSDGPVETPPATPETQLPNKEAIKEELQAELDKLTQQVDAKFAQIRDHVAKKTESGHKKLIVEDHIAMAVKAQCDVRALCNEIFNPGVEMASRCTTLLEDAKRNHASKFEKFAYDMTERLDATEITIRRKKDQLKHEIELYERTLVTLREEQEKRDKDAQEATEQLVEGVAAKASAPRREELVTIEEETEKEESVKGDSGQGDGSDTEECIIVEDEKDSDNDGDDDKTDIEEVVDEDNPERPFTPCQAQRPV